MGTRSLTYVYDTWTNDNDERVDTPVVCMYRQFDGYPEGHGIELARFLNKGRLVNGLGSDINNVFNGMGCLAAQMVANFKNGPGGFYLHAPILDRDDWQDYEYHIFEDKVKVFSGSYGDNRVLFVGTWDKFLEFCSAEETV